MIVSLHSVAIFWVGLVGAFIGAGVGGSGLIIVPGIIFLGLSPQAAVATNQFGLIGETLGSWLLLHKAKKIDYRLAFKLSFLAAAGAAAGAATLIHLDSKLVEKLVGLLVLGVGLAVYRKKEVGTETAKLGKLQHRVGIAYVLYSVVGFWGGLFGAGFGLLARYILLFGFRKSLLESAGVSKLTTVAIAVVSIPIFLSKGLFDWNSAVPLFIGMVVGSLFGIRYALKIGDEKLRMLFLVMVVISGLKLLLP